MYINKSVLTCSSSLSRSYEFFVFSKSGMETGTDVAYTRSPGFKPRLDGIVYPPPLLSKLVVSPEVDKTTITIVKIHTSQHNDHVDYLIFNLRSLPRFAINKYCRKSFKFYN